VKTSTEYDNISTHYLVIQLTISKPNLPTGLDDHIYDPDYEVYHKVNCLKDHKLHNNNIHDIYASPQPTLYMPKPTYPMIFKSTSNSNQSGDMTQAPYPCIDRCRPKLSKAYWSSYKNANDFPHTRRRRLSTHTNSSTFCSPFLCIRLSQCLVFSVCPAYYCLYPCFLCYFLISNHL
jgi:hypothetical protein